MARRMAKGEEPDAQNDDIDDEEDSELENDPSVRAKLIKKARSKVKSLQARVDALHEEAAPHKKEISAQFRTLKSKTGLTRKEAEFVFWSMDLDDDVRDNSLDRIFEAFAACGASVRSEAERATKQAEETPAAPRANGNGNGAEHSDAFNRGFDSLERGEADNPYKGGTKLAREWAAGRAKAQESTSFETGASH